MIADGFYTLVKGMGTVNISQSLSSVLKVPRPSTNLHQHTRMYICLLGTFHSTTDRLIFSAVSWGRNALLSNILWFLSWIILHKMIKGKTS